MAETVRDRQQLIFLMGRVLVIHVHVRRTKCLCRFRVTVITVDRIMIDILHIHVILRETFHLATE